MISTVRRLSVAEIEGELRSFETKYNMRSDEFHERYIHGKIDHGRDFVRWMGLIRMHIASKTRKGAVLA